MAKSQSEKRPAAFYRHFDTRVTIEGTAYRAIVLHSSAYDKRRQKRIDRIIKNNKSELGKKIKDMIHQPFKCLPDAEAVAAELINSVRTASIECMQTLPKSLDTEEDAPKREKPENQNVLNMS